MRGRFFAILAVMGMALIFTAAVFMMNCRKNNNQKNMVMNNQQMPNNRFKLTSKLFRNFAGFPEAHTCDGVDTNPPLEIANVPAKAESLALVLRDPDAPGGVFIHWLVFNIDPKTKTIEINSVPEGATLGKTTNGKTHYVGPCPPSGTHRYIFTIYALNEKLLLNEGASMEQLNAAMAGHIIATAELQAKFR